jgi:hypothetical protein
MSLLFDFLKNLPAADRNKIVSQTFKGKTDAVFRAIIAQTETGVYEREKIQGALNLSGSHFDKITSELLSKCFAVLYPEGGLPLLNYLSMRVAFNKLFYKELSKQMKQVALLNNKKQKADFYKGAINHIHFNLPIINKNSKVLAALGKEYIAAAPSQEKPDAILWVNCRTLYNKIDNLFAASKVKEKAPEIFKELQQLGNAYTIKNHELLFEYYWVVLYYYMAIEDFSKAADIATEAIEHLQQHPHENSALNILRLELKLSELYYFSSRFDESYQKYRSVFTGPQADIIPERGYHTTKYIQICLITGNLKDAKLQIDKMRAFYGKNLEETLPVRDIFSFIKYYLFAGDYDNAFRFIQLGFQRNPKGKYFQYEVELRNLQVALFYLTGRPHEALQMCERNIKYLRAHGHPVKDSNYPYFYILTRAIFEEKTTGRKFKSIEEEKMQRYLQGSFGVYGQLLLKMKNYQPQKEKRLK